MQIYQRFDFFRLSNRFLNQCCPSLGVIGRFQLETSYNPETWAALIQEAVAKSEEVESLVYLQVTRGVAGERSHVYPDAAPTVLITVTPAVLRTTTPKPLDVVTKVDFRWHRADIKVTSLIANGRSRSGTSL